MSPAPRTVTGMARSELPAMFFQQCRYVFGCLQQAGQRNGGLCKGIFVLASSVACALRLYIELACQRF